jgi:hypothetical protein
MVTIAITAAVAPATITSMTTIAVVIAAIACA